MHLTEGRNTGFGKILRVLEKNGSPKPIFETDDERISFAATIFIHHGFVDKESLPSGKDNGKDKNANGDEKVLPAIRNNPQITISAIAATTGLGERTVSRIIKKLKTDGALIREGTRNGRWSILK